MRNQKYSIKISFERNLRPNPEPHELWAAEILAEHYNTEILFLRRGIGKTADFKFDNRIWELKSPRGNSKRTIENNLRTASQQSENVIISLLRTKMQATQAISKIKHYIGNEKTDTSKELLLSRKIEKYLKFDSYLI